MCRTSFCQGQAARDLLMVVRVALHPGIRLAATFSHNARLLDGRNDSSFPVVLLSKKGEIITLPI